MQPINYLPQGVPDPFGASMLGAYKAGVDMQQVQFAQQQQQQALAAAQAKAERDAFVQQRLSEFMGKDPKTLRLEDYQAVTPLLPKEQADSLRANFELQSKEQQNAQLSFGGQVMAAFQADQLQIGIQLLRERAQAARNTGKEDDAKAYETWARLAEVSPDQALKTIGGMLAVVPGGDKVLKSVIDNAAEARKQQLFPSELTRSEADARKAGAQAITAEAEADPQMIAARLNEQLAKTNKEAVAAKFAESKAVQDLRMSEAQIKALADDAAIKRQNVAIAATNAATARAGNDLKRQELQLKLNELVDKRDSAVREKVAQAEQGASNIDNMMNTIERIKKNPALDAVIGPLEGGALFPQTVMGMQPFTASADDRADAIALIETLGSQAFLSQIPLIKGMGHLSNAEGDKLQSAFQNLTRKQSEKQFRATLDEATRLLNKARGNIAKSAGIELPKPDTPAAPGAKPPLSSFMRP